MAKRKVPLLNGEYYHIYNRGVDKRNIFTTESDIERFTQSMREFNTVEPIGSIYENSFRKVTRQTINHQLGNQVSKLVEIISYCINPNHYHFILRQIEDQGISKFMKSLNGGYTKYFNEKNKRNGSLFQGKFQSVHVASNEQLLYVHAYVNLNYIVHGLVGVNGEPISNLIRSSWNEYIGKNKNNMCEKDIILGQFENIDTYKKDSLAIVSEIAQKRHEFKNFLLEE